VLGDITASTKLAINGSNEGQSPRFKKTLPNVDKTYLPASGSAAQRPAK
jgi:hypothetical protein